MSTPSLCMDVLRTGDFLRTKISRKHRLPYFLTHGTSLDVGQGWLCLNSNREWVWCHVIMVTKFLDLNHTCLTEMAILENKQWKKSLGYCRFVPEWNHVQESHTCQFFFCHICRTMVCWDAEILLQRARAYIFQWPFLWSSQLKGVVIYHVWRGSGKVRIFVYYLKILHIVALELQEEEINAEKIMAVTDAAPKAEIVSLTAMIFFAFSLWEWTELCVTINFINVQDNNNAEA